MDHKEFDKTIKKELKKELHNWNKDAMWQTIENELPEKDSKRPFALWVIGGVLLFMAGALYFLIQINHKVDSIIELQTNEPSSESVLAPANQNNDNVFHKDIQRTTIDAQNHKAGAESQKNNPLILHSNPTVSNSKSDQKNATKNISPIAKPDLPDSKVSSNLLKENASAAIDQRDDKTTIIVEEKITKYSGTSFKPVILQSTQISDLPSPKATIKQESVVTDLIKPLKKYPEFSLEVYGGIGFFNKTLTAENQEFSSFRYKKERAEKNLEHIRFGAKVSYQVLPNIKITTGLDYLVMHELFNGQKDSSKVFLEQANASTYRAVTEISTRTVKHYNTYTQINIPISVAYTNQWKRLRYALYGGFNWNIYSHMKGKSFDTNQYIVDLSNLDFYKSRNAHSYFFGIKTGFPLRKKLYLNASFQYDQLFNNIINSYPGLNQRYRLFGVHIGVEYLFD